MLISAFCATFWQFFSNVFLDIERFYQVLSTCQISDQLDHSNYREGQTINPKQARGADSAWGELPYEEYMGSYFQEKIPKRVCHFFTKIPERAIISVRNSR